MTWYLHGIVTISHSKVFWWAVEWEAHKILRKHAMGSYRTLLKKMTVTPAMLIYLDGSWSTIEGSGGFTRTAVGTPLSRSLRMSARRSPAAGSLPA